MNRRSFMWISSMSTFAMFLPLTSCFRNSSDLDSLLALPISLSYIFDKEKISELGKLYLTKTQNESKEKHLKKLLLEGFYTKDESILSQDTSSTINELFQKIKTDFQTDQTIELDGWILSLTEARQCALFFLTNN